MIAISPTLKTPKLDNGSSLARPELRILPNGLRVLAEQIPVDAVNLSIWVNVGSAFEADEINGMAHFLEHMIFKGTERQRVGEFEQAIESCGGNTNAATSQDYTHYYINVAPKDFAKFAPLQLDLVCNARIPDPEFERERAVVLEEIRRSEDSPERRLYRHSVEQLFSRLPYRRPVLGPTSVIEQVTAPQMRAFHQQWYHPENMTVVIVGNLPVTQMIDVVADFFANQPPHPLPQPTMPHHQPETNFPTICRSELVDQGLQQPRLLLGWRLPGLQQCHKTTDYRTMVILSILSSILTGGRTSRLIQELREKRHLVDRISASATAFRWQGIFQIAAKRPGDDTMMHQLPVVEEHLQTEIERLIHSPVTTEELAKIRTQVANRFIFASESPREKAGLYGYYDRVVGNLEVALHYPEIVRSITPEEIQAVAATYLDPAAYSSITAVPRS